MAKKLNQAVKILTNGGVIAFPTDTVFGIGALLSRPAAIRKIFKIKKRPRTKPLQVLVANLNQALKLGKFNKKTIQFAKKFWPGPYTLVIKKSRLAPKLVTGGSSKVGLRIPAHRTILALIKIVGPLVATSANMAGEKPVLTAKAIKKILPQLDYYLPGRIKSGKASKVIDLSGKTKVLRK